MSRRLAVALLVVTALTVAGTAVAQTAQRFSDVPPEHEAHTAVEWAADVGLTVGYGDGTFGPDDPMSRWQAVTFMERYFDQILGADGRGGFTSDEFTRGDMMILLKAIDDGDGSPARTEPEPEPQSGRWLPRPENRTADGRCAHLIDDTNFYDWEECAWGRHPDPVMGRAEMQTLAAEVWGQTMARGKPDSPPALVEGQCRSAHAAACYIPATHTISIESGVTRWSLLHELAHALISGDDIMADCYADWRARVPSCAHGALFRCAADALYVRYADIDTAGVCGAVPDTGDWSHHTRATIDGVYAEWRTMVDAYGGDTPGVGGDVTLGIRCARGQRTVYFNGTLAYGPHGRPAYADYRTGDMSAPVTVPAIEIDNPDGGYGDWWTLSPQDEALLLAALAADDSGRLFLRLWHDDSVEAEATLRTTGYRTHVRPFVEACG